MLSLLQRRRQMMLQRAAGPTPVVWSYSDGLPGDNGFVLSTNGTRSETLKSTCVELTASGSSSHTTYELSGNYTQAEASFDAIANNAQVLLVLYTGSRWFCVRFQYSNNYKGLYLVNASAIASMTKLATVALNTSYTIKLVISGATGSVYLNGSLLQSNIDLSTIVASGNTRARFGYSGSVATKIELYTMKFS